MAEQLPKRYHVIGDIHTAFVAEVLLGDNLDPESEAVQLTVASELGLRRLGREEALDIQAIIELDENGQEVHDTSCTRPSEHETSNATLVQVIAIHDRTTGKRGEIDIYRHENGAFFAIDTLYLTSAGVKTIDTEDRDSDAIVPDPLSPGNAPTLVRLRTNESANDTLGGTTS